MTAKEAAVWTLPNAFGCELVGWDGWNEWCGGPPPGPTGHTRILYGPHLYNEDLAPGRWLQLVGGREAFLAAHGPEDIAWVPLWRSVTEHPAWDADRDRCADYAAHVALIQDLAPRVRGVLVGNMGPELCGHIGAGSRYRRAEVLRFVDAGARIVSEAGGKPFFGTLDWTLLMDCYTGGALRDTMGAVGATQICFCGFSLSPECWFDKDFHHWILQRKYQVERDGEAPSRRLRDYVASVPMWSDLNWFDGLHHGNDVALKRVGFVRGCV